MLFLLASLQNDGAGMVPPAEGPGEGGGGGEAPKDFTKPRQTIQSPNRLYKNTKY